VLDPRNLHHLSQVFTLKTVRASARRDQACRLEAEPRGSEASTSFADLARGPNARAPHRQFRLRRSLASRLDRRKLLNLSQVFGGQAAKHQAMPPGEAEPSRVRGAASLDCRACPLRSPRPATASRPFVFVSRTIDGSRSRSSPNGSFVVHTTFAHRGSPPSTLKRITCPEPGSTQARRFDGEHEAMSSERRKGADLCSSVV
jgi:hypothetical protein